MLYSTSKGTRAELIATPYGVCDRSNDTGGALLALRERVGEAHRARIALINAAIAEVSK